VRSLYADSESAGLWGYGGAQSGDEGYLEQHWQLDSAPLLAVALGDFCTRDSVGMHWR